jgi:fructose-bisphosphate aldolase class II
MPVADYQTYVRMLENASKNHFAYPAINISSMVTANAVLQAFAEKRCDGIIQVSTGGAQFAAGLGTKNAVVGAITLAEHITRMAECYDINIALHTDHCPPDKVDSFLIPLIEESERRVAAGQPPLFSSHMFDGAILPLKENLVIAVKLHERMSKIGMILEVEAGVVGGEEDGVSHDVSDDKLYTTAEDMLEVQRRMSEVEGTYMFAATFGNVHGVYKPGNVQLRPKILKEGQDAVIKALGEAARLYLVFHGGSGSTREDIHETLEYGVIKMNVDTDTQYAFSRPIVDHMLKHYDGMLKIDGDVGTKKLYDPRSYLKLAEQSMTERVKVAVDDLKAGGTTLA